MLNEQFNWIGIEASLALLVLPGIIFWSIQPKLEFSNIKFDFPLVCLKSVNFYENLGNFSDFFFDLNRAIWLWKFMKRRVNMDEPNHSQPWWGLFLLNYETKLIGNVVRLPNDAKFPKKSFAQLKVELFEILKCLFYFQ